MISFIVLAGGAGPGLERTLAGVDAAVRSLTEPCELIVVDTGGDQGVAALATSARSRGLAAVQFVLDQGSALYEAGARAAHGDTLLFVTSGAEVTARAVREAVRALREGAVGGEAKASRSGGLARLGSAVRRLIGRIAGAPAIPATPLIFCTRSAFESGALETPDPSERAVRARLARQGRFVLLRELLAC